MAISGKISRFILSIAGWKVKGKKPDMKKYILLAAPHTSNWDFPMGRLTNSALDIDLKVLMKKSWFFFPLKYLFNYLGAVPIDREKSGTVIDNALEIFKNNDEFVFALAPEGTRSFVDYWKTGFYTIANQAKIPIVLAYLDYQKKEGGIGPIIFPSGNETVDFEKIMSFYRNIHPKFPEKFNQHPRFGK